MGHGRATFEQDTLLAAARDASQIYIYIYIPIYPRRSQHIREARERAEQRKNQKMRKPARLALLSGCLLWPAAGAFSPPLPSALPSRGNVPDGPLSASTIADNDSSSATSSGSSRSGDAAQAEVQTRPLGSQELLMLPRQYSPSEGAAPFPQMNHVTVVTLSATPPLTSLLKAIGNAMATHPLLRGRVEGSGEPEERVDLFQMVRKGNPDPERFVSPANVGEAGFAAADVLTVIDVEVGAAMDGGDALARSWEASFRRDLDDGSWCDTSKGPLWKVELHRLAGGTTDAGGDDGEGQEEDGGRPCALLLSFNHAISDQSSANLLIDQLLSDVAAMDTADDDSSSTANNPTKAVPQSLPLGLEQSVLGVGRSFAETNPEGVADLDAGGITLDTVKYVAGKAAEGLKSPVILPDSAEGKDRDDGAGIVGALSTIAGKSAGGSDATGAAARRSAVSFRTLDARATGALLDQCRGEGVRVTHALTAAVALTASDHIGGGKNANADAAGRTRNYKVLQSLDMRRFGERLDKGDTVACMAGSMDLMLGPLPDGSGDLIRGAIAGISQFWDLAREGKKQTESFVASGGPAQAVRVFDAFMTVADGNNLVHLTAESAASQGRAYSAGVSNVGVFERQRAVQREGEETSDGRRDNLMSKHGRYEIRDIYFATPHSRSGCLYQVSGQTIHGEMKLTFHPAKPIVSEETNAAFADAFVELLEVAAGVKEPASTDTKAEMMTNGGEDGGPLSKFPPNFLSLAALAFSIGGIAIHGGAWADFFQSVGQMKANVADPADATAALNFWIFFAVGHPILQPILWISDVLDGTPGPTIADLVPYLFLAGNVVAIGAIAFSKEIRNAVNIAAVGAFGLRRCWTGRACRSGRFQPCPR